MARQPKTQQAILQLLTQEHLLTAPEIVERLAKNQTAVNKTTVYRAVEKLLTAGTLCKILLKDDVPSYELRADHHDHFICERCGRIEKIACQQINLPNLEGKTVDHHHLTLYGVCERCAASSSDYK